MSKNASKKPSDPLSVREDEALSTAASDHEPTGSRLAVAAQPLLLALLCAVLWIYREAHPASLTAAVSAVLIALIAFRFDRIKKLTSKLVSVEMQPAVQRANKATLLANKAAQEAFAKAEHAQSAANELESKLARVEETLELSRSVTVSLTRLVLRTAAWEGRFGSGAPESARLQLAATYEDHLRAIGCSASDAREITQELRDSVVFDLGSEVIQAACKEILRRDGTQSVKEPAYTDFTSMASGSDTTFRMVSPAAMRVALEKHQLSEAEPVRDAFARFERFVASGELAPDSSS